MADDDLAQLAIEPCAAPVQRLGTRVASHPMRKPSRRASWSRTLVRGLMICGGSVAILLPAWLPNGPSAPLERGTVELLQALLLTAAAAVIFGVGPHAGILRPMCWVMGLGLSAAVVGELEDFLSGILGWSFPEAWVIGVLLLIALIIALRHRTVTSRFMATLGNHAGSGFIAAALLILYVFNRVIGSERFWQAALGEAFSPAVPRMCKSYLELLACYLIFVGTLGFALTMGRRKEDVL